MNRLIGTCFHSIHRCVDMLCLQLGRDIVVLRISEDENTKPQVYAEYSLHLQTQWRFTLNDTILLASRDIYEPFSEETDENWQYDILGRPDHESSIFDVKKKQLEKMLKGSHVVNTTTTPMGDIRIEFSNHIFLEVFISASYKDEEWRLIDFAKDEHIIFYDVY